LKDSEEEDDLVASARASQHHQGNEYGFLWDLNQISTTKCNFMMDFAILELP
jgi:hypothetical protein